MFALFRFSLSFLQTNLLGIDLPATDIFGKMFKMDVFNHLHSPMTTSPQTVLQWSSFFATRRKNWYFPGW